MSRQYLNLTASAWRQLRSNWRLPASPNLLWQTLGPGSVFSLLSRMQETVSRDQLAKANFRDAIVVLGYWRSGTTLLHELLCLDTRFTYPTTHACMNPHHFLFSEASALAQNTSSAQRPMDDMEVRPSSPQEDEFALLSLGARSPYEALLIPAILSESLKLTDPRDLSPADEQHWREVFLRFLAGVSVRGEGRPMILKSPTHGARVDTLRELLPDARYILIFRDPVTSFESVVRMWRKMFEMYALGPVPPEDDIRQAVLDDRPRFEAKLTAGTRDLPENRFVAIKYESLVADPIRTIERLYQQLAIGEFEPVRESIVTETQRRSGYHAKGVLPSQEWQDRIGNAWRPVLASYAALNER